MSSNSRLSERQLLLLFSYHIILSIHFNSGKFLTRLALHTEHIGNG